MEKRGFTLVELLAVIVILAIIALIAVPIFLGIINKSKSNADKEGVNLYTDTVEKTIQKKQMADPNFQPDKCEIQSDGNLECYNGTTSLGTVKVTMKGKKPTAGTILIDDDEITYQNIVLNGKTYYKVETSVETVSYATLVTDASPTGLSVGDKYTYKVNATDTFNFYVLSIDGDEVSLIMDRNICNDGTAATEQNTCLVAWHESEEHNNNYGPDTAMTYLYNGTKNWTNVPDITMNYTDENNSDSDTRGYTSITTSNGVTTITGKNGATNTTIGTSALPLKARLPKKSEMTGAECTESSASCPAWLVEYLRDTASGTDASKYPDNENISGISGYWLLSSHTSVAPPAAWTTLCAGYINDSGTSSSLGVRPVITVSKSDL